MTAPVVLAIDGNSLVHRSYHAQAEDNRWARVDADRPRDEVRADVRRLVSQRLGLL